MKENAKKSLNKKKKIALGTRTLKSRDKEQKYDKKKKWRR